MLLVGRVWEPRWDLTYKGVGERNNDPQPVLPRLENGPVDRRECLLIHYPERRHDAQRVPRADPQRLAPDGLRPHRHQRIHNLRDAAEGRVTRLERLVIRLSSRRNHILVKAKPVNIRSAPNVSLAVEQQLRALARNI